MIDYIKLMRPKHYIKNLLVFLPLVFSGMLFKNNNFFITFIAFCCFCLMASSIYIMNDILDRKKDSKHDEKKKRPIASGRVSVGSAVVLIILCLLVLTALLVFSHISIYSIVFLALYLIINVAYSFGLKNIPILDVSIIAAGFVIRVLYGATALNIEVSNWLYLTILTGSFYLAMGKRRNEINKIGSKARGVLKYYNKDFLDKNMYMLLTMAIIFYSLWTIDNTIISHYHNLLIWTVPLVIVISMKYSMDIEKNNFGDPTEIILSDVVLITLSFILAAIVFAIVYLK